jgi:hypothetical protein
MPRQTRRPPRISGEGRNRTGDTTIFSRGSRCDRRTRPEATGDDLPANRIYRDYRDLWSVSRDAALVRARGRQVDVRGLDRQGQADAHEAGGECPHHGGTAL